MVDLKRTREINCEMQVQQATVGRVTDKQNPQSKKRRNLKYQFYPSLGKRKFYSVHYTNIISTPHFFFFFFFLLFKIFNPLIFSRRLTVAMKYHNGGRFFPTELLLFSYKRLNLSLKFLTTQIILVTQNVIRTLQIPALLCLRSSKLLTLRFHTFSVKFLRQTPQNHFRLTQSRFRLQIRVLHFNFTIGWIIRTNPPLRNDLFVLVHNLLHFLGGRIG